MGFETKEIGGYKVIDEGKGEPLILLHGLFGGLANFDTVVTHFSSSYRTIVPILPLYDLPIRETTVIGLVAYLKEFIDFFKFEKINLLGNSLGGHVALVYTLENKAKVKSLILTGSSGLYEKAFGDTIPKRGDYDYLKEKAEQTFYDPKNATKELVDEIFATVTDREKAIRVISMAKSAVRHNLSEELSQIDIPTFLIWGINDTITPLYVGEEFEKLIPNAKLVSIDKCGHAPMMEHPEIFNKLLEGFLRSI